MLLLILLLIKSYNSFSPATRKLFLFFFFFPACFYLFNLLKGTTIKPHSKCVRSDIFILGRALKSETPAIGRAREAEAAPAAGRNAHQVALQGREGLRSFALISGAEAQLCVTMHSPEDREVAS